MGRDRYDGRAFDDEPSIEVSFGRTPTPRTIVAFAPRHAPLSELPAEIDAAFQPWIANVTPHHLPAALPARRPKATPAPRLSTRMRYGLAATDLGHLGLDEEKTIPELDPTTADRIDGGDPGQRGLIDGKYRVEAVLGAGGMGIVVAASHVHLGTTVAIKTLRPEAAIQPECARRFLREARAASRLRSEHVCRALDVGRLASGEPYIVMEMLHGRDLASLVHAQGPLAVADAAAYVLQACEAVAEAHALGMVHRDLKPANLMLTRKSDGAPHVKVLDFGIATSATGDIENTAPPFGGSAGHGQAAAIDGRLTRADVAMGSPGYMSPEQLRSAKSVDARSDIWSLGVTLYELVSGQAPFCGDTVSAIAIAVATEEPAPLRGVPVGFAAVVARCLRKPAAERFGSIAELAAALAPFVHDGAARAARIASAVHAFVPPTLMAFSGAGAAVTVAPPRAAPVFFTGTALVVAPPAEATQRMRRVYRSTLSVVVLVALAVCALTLLALVAR